MQQGQINIESTNLSEQTQHDLPVFAYPFHRGKSRPRVWCNLANPLDSIVGFDV